MDAIHFTTESAGDNLIRVPEGITLPQGQVQVTVVPCSSSEAPARRDVWDWLLEMAAEAEKLPTELPQDMAENHDFYAHGKPRE